MSSSNEQQLVERVHASGKHFLLAITGGGSRAIANLLEVPGASASVVGAIVPYAPAALESWLGGPVDQHCSERTSRAMAMRAFELARQFCDAEPSMLRGIGATASLATNRPKRGPHRIHAAWQSADATVSLSCELTKGARSRAEEEAIATQLVLTAVCEACGVEGACMLEPAVADSVHRREQHAPAAWRELLLGERGCVTVLNEGTTYQKKAPSLSESGKPVVLFPGAFNPLHAGHLRMAEVAAERYGVPVTFEISITNVDKPPLDFIELEERLQQLTGRQVLLTRAPRFAEKAHVAPGCVFAVGVDTLIRIGDTRYYGGEIERRDAAVEAIASQGCRFLVFGRSVDDRFMGLPDVDVPTKLRELCEEVSERMFRADVSSTDLRALRQST
jgi:nicotinamide mononucleotide (NMN) deamidase PncC